MVREGVDYSRTGSANWNALAAALKANGKGFVGRYAVNDKSPTGRGITADEYQAMRAAGLDVFLYWQTTTNWMLGGWSAGVQGANNAQMNIAAAGMPLDIPVYFACDFDANESQQAAIDECLRGAASVLGFERVGLYAGRWPLIRSMANKSARWFCQTSAWSGGVIVPGIHLYQYEYNQWYGGTNCDDVRAYQENFGQADYDPPVVPAVIKPRTITWEPGDVGIEDYHGTPVLKMRIQVVAPHGTQPRLTASSKKKNGYGPVVPPMGEITIVGTTDSGWGFVEMPDGTYPRVSLRRVKPTLPRPKNVPS